MPVGPPEARLAVAVLEPGDYELEYTYNSGPNSEDDSIYEFKASMKLGTGPDRAQLPEPVGPIFLLHGYGMTKEAISHWAFRLAVAGYRTVLVDLRGHGQSTGRRIAFGAVEADDLRLVFDELERQGQIAGPVGVLGISYGAAMAIQWAVKDDRIGAVVALAPYSSVPDAIRGITTEMMPRLAEFLGPERIDRSIDIAAERLGITWDAVDVAQAAARLSAPVLLIHGSNDTWVPLSNSQRIRASAPAGTQLLVGQGDHMALSGRLEPIDANVVAWFEEHLLAPTP